MTLLALFNYLVFHNLNSKAYLESFNEYNERITKLAFQNIDQQIMEAAVEIPQLYFSNIRQNDDILLPQEKEIVGSPSYIKNFKNHMEEIKKSCPYVASFDIYYEGTQTAVTGFFNVHEVMQKENLENYLPWYEAYEETGKDTVFLSSSIYPTRESVITYVKRISQPKWKGRGIIVAIHISTNEFHRFIDETTGNLILLSPDGEILYSTSPQKQEITEGVVKNLRNKEEIDGESVISMATRIGDQDMMIFESPFPKTGLEYVYYVQNSIFFADYNVKNRIFFMNFFISVFYNLLILVVFSLFNHHIYKKQLVEASKEAGIEIKEEQGFNNSLNVLTKEIGTLNEKVKYSRTIMFQNEVRALILNRRLDGGGESLKEYLCYDSLCTVLLYYEDSTGIIDTATRLQEEFLSCSQDYKGLFTTMERGEVVAILVADRKDFEEISKAFTDRIREMGETCQIVIGAVFDLTKENIRASYLNASETARYRFIYSNRPIFTCDDVDAEHRKSSGSHLKLFEAIEKDINSENLMDLKYHIHALTVSFTEGNYTIDYCISSLRDLVTFLYQMIGQKQLDMWIMFGYDIRKYYQQIENIKEFEDWVLDLCEVLLQNMREKKQTVDTDMQASLIKMIDEQLEHDISLNVLADHFSMRPDVLSRLFKQMMGKGYTEYIKEKKMERALKLIEEDCSMKEIAYRLGYNSPQYFIKIFKETYGVTPYQYKKQSQKES